MDPGWTITDFVKFYRPIECQRAMAIAREREGNQQTEEKLQRAALLSRGNKASPAGDPLSMWRPRSSTSRRYQKSRAWLHALQRITFSSTPPRDGEGV